MLVEDADRCRKPDTHWATSMGTRLSSNHWSRSRSATTSPITITTGGSSRARAARAAMSRRVPVTVSCALVVPQRTRATGAAAGNDLERNPRPRQGVGLFAAAPEHERIAALEPHDPPPPPRVRDQQHVDLLLR